MPTAAAMMDVEDGLKKFRADVKEAIKFCRTHSTTGKLKVTYNDWFFISTEAGKDEFLGGNEALPYQNEDGSFPTIEEVIEDSGLDAPISRLNKVVNNPDVDMATAMFMDVLVADKDTSWFE